MDRIGWKRAPMRTTREVSSSMVEGSFKSIVSRWEMDHRGPGMLKPMPFTTSDAAEVDGTDYDKVRKYHKLKNEGQTNGLGTRTLATEMSCPICLDLLTQTMTAKECLHRFCSDCITMALQRGNKECPTCRKKLVSKRSLRPDPKFDLLISKIWPDRSIYENMQHNEIDSLTSQTSTNALMNSIGEGIKAQEINRRKRIQGSYEDKNQPPATSQQTSISDVEMEVERIRNSSVVFSRNDGDASRKGPDSVFNSISFNNNNTVDCPSSSSAYDFVDDEDFGEYMDTEDYGEVKQEGGEEYEDAYELGEDDVNGLTPEQANELRQELEELDNLEYEEFDYNEFEKKTDEPPRDDPIELPPPPLNLLQQHAQFLPPMPKMNSILSNNNIEEDDSDSSSSTYSSSGCTSSSSEDSSSLSFEMSEPSPEPEVKPGPSLSALAQNLPGIDDINALTPITLENYKNSPNDGVHPPKHSIAPKDRLTHWLANSPSSPQTPDEDMNDLPERTADDEMMDSRLKGVEEIEAELLPAVSLFFRNCHEELLIPRYVKTKHDTTMQHLGEFLHQKAMEDVQSNQNDFDADPVPTLPIPNHFYVFSRNGGHHIRKIFLHETVTTAACSNTKGDHLIIFYDTEDIQLRGERKSLLADVVPSHFLSLPTV